MAGLEQVIQYIQELEFSDKDIEYLRSKKIFDEGFLNYLKNFKFTQHSDKRRNANISYGACFNHHGSHY